MSCEFCNSEGTITIMRYLKSQKGKKGKIVDTNTWADCPKCNGSGEAI